MKDFDRPLNDRGNRDAETMAKRALDRNIKPDVFITSTAVRAMSTARYFIKVFEPKKDRVLELHELYHAPVSAFYHIIMQLDDKYDTAIFFSHNPGITEMVNSLGVAKLDNMPTCGMFAVHTEAKNWVGFRDAPRHFWFFDYPKRQV